MTRQRATMLAALLISGVLPGTARAHEIGGRLTAPIPLELLFGAAAIAVAMTALLLSFTPRETPLEEIGPIVSAISPSVARALPLLSRGLFFIAFFLTVLVGIFGQQVPADNFATVFVWPVWLNGVALISALLGSPWAILSPWKRLYDGLARIEARPMAGLGEYPSWAGAWPAIVGFLLWIGSSNTSLVSLAPRA